MKKNLMIAFCIVCIMIISTTGCAFDSNDSKKTIVNENELKQEKKTNEMNAFLKDKKDDILFIRYASDRFIVGILEGEKLRITTFDKESEKLIASIKMNGLDSLLKGGLKFYENGFILGEGTFEEQPYLVIYDYDLNEKQRIDLNLIMDGMYTDNYAITNDFKKIAYSKYDDNEVLKSYLIIKNIKSNTVVDTFEMHPKTVNELGAVGQFSFSKDNNYIYYSGFSPKEIRALKGYDSIENISTYGVIDLINHKIDNIVLKEIQFVSNQNVSIVGFNSDEPIHTTARDHIFMMINGKIEKIETSGMESEYIQIADEGNAFLLTDKIHEESTNGYSMYTQRLFVDNKEVFTITPKDFGVDGEVHYNDVISVVIDTKGKSLYYFYTNHKNGEMKRTKISYGGE